MRMSLPVLRLARLGELVELAVAVGVERRTGTSRPPSARRAVSSHTLVLIQPATGPVPDIHSVLSAS